MDARVKAVAEECTRASDEELISFPAVVAKLVGAGVERYHADLVRSEKIYYMPDGDFHATPSAAVRGRPPREFSAQGVEAAVRAIQGGRIQYKEFCERILAAGCVGYFVTLPGRRAVYYGRTAEVYVEPFPPAR